VTGIIALIFLNRSFSASLLATFRRSNREISWQSPITNYVKLNETIAGQISFIEGGGKIVPAGANREQAADATTDWLETLMKYHAECEVKISELQRQGARS
jgi:hypothetical protein